MTILVRSEQDLPRLRQAVPPAYFAAVADWFNALAEAPDSGDSGVSRKLHCGCIRVLTTDDGEDLQPLLTSWPEYAELFQVDAGLLWKVVVMVDNDCFETWFAPHAMSPDLDSWVERYRDN